MRTIQGKTGFLNLFYLYRMMKKTACVKHLKSSKQAWTSVLKNHLFLRTDNYLEQIPEPAYLPSRKEINVCY